MIPSHSVALLGGVFAALPTPVTATGAPDLAALDRVCDLALDAGVGGICLSGATGEYPHFEIAERRAVIRHVALRMPVDRVLLAAVGAASAPLTVDLGRAAVDAGCLAVLLPMPGFFKYEQEDLAAFALDISHRLAAPCLLYNLPAFTNPLGTETIAGLLATGGFLVGVKDSSGDPAMLGDLARRRGSQPWSLLVGDDRRIRDGMGAGWNGVVSGMAACCPELVVALVRSLQAGDEAAHVRWQALLDELVGRLMVLPVPWGIRVALAARGLPTGSLPLPVTPARRRQIEAITAWFPDWLRDAGLSAPVRR